MDFFVNIFSVIIEFLCIFVSSRAFSQTPLRPQGADIVFGITIIATGSIISDSFGVLLLLLGQILYLSYVLYRYTGRITHRIFLFILSFGFHLLSQLIIMVIVVFLPLNTTAWYFPLLANAMTLALICLVCHYCPIYKLYTLIVNGTFPLLFIILNTYIALVIFLLMGKLDLHGFYNQYIFVIAIITLLFAANTSILYYEQKMKYQEQELLSYQTNLPIYDTLIHDIRASQHEYANHIQTLQTLPASCPDYDSLCDALKKYSGHYAIPQRAYPLLQINMPLLAASLYNLYTVAERKEISMLFDISTPQLESTVSEHILTDFACVLTNNAIEASKAGDTLYIRLYSENGRTHFEIRNPSKEYFPPNRIQQFFQKGYTTKEKKKEDGISHGYGLYHLLKKMRALNGGVGGSSVKFRDGYLTIFFVEI